MTYTVTYREKRGNIATQTIEAESRTDLFSILKKRGIVAIKVTEGAAEKKNGYALKRRIKVLASLLLLITAVIVSFFFYFGRSPAPEKQSPTKKAEVKHPDVKTVKVKPVRIKTPATNTVRKTKHFWEVDASQTNGFTEVQMKKWRKENRVRPSYTNTTSLTEKPPPYAIFKTRCENEIACFLTMTPGETLVGTPHYTPKQKQEFIKALDAPMIESEDDTPEDRELRRLVEVTKAELKKRIAEGEDIGDIFTSTREEFQDLARYKNEMAKALSELRKDPNTTIEEIDELLKTANAELEEKGIAPLKLGVISRRMLQQYHNNTDKKRSKK